LVEESHSDGLLEYPVYTKPAVWREREVPAVLLSGNHGKIAQWRRHEQFRRTASRRPDLLEGFDAGSLPRADRTELQNLGYDVVDGKLIRRPEATGQHP
jgi:tRNA (guanine37-N1)-methyltransferase